MLRKFNKLAFSGTQSARAAANWQKEIYTTVDYDPNEPKVRFKVFFQYFTSPVYFFGENFETNKSLIKSWSPIVVKSPAVYSRLQLKWESKQFQFILMPMLKLFMLIWPTKKLTLVQLHLLNHISLWTILSMPSVSNFY